MNRYLTWLLLLGIVFAVNVKQKVKKKFTVSGVVQNSAGKRIKKVKLSIINEEGKKIESGKSKGGGEFKFKKIRAGSYTLMGEHKKEGILVSVPKDGLLGSYVFNVKVCTALPCDSSNQYGNTQKFYVNVK